MQQVLVVGASGVVGRAAAAAFAEAGWQVTGLSRRDPEAPGCRHLGCDLTDAAAARAALAGEQFSHVVYAALYEQPGLLAGWQDAGQMATNLAMLRHTMEPLMDGASAATLRHVSLLQGTKAYGAHVHPMAVPGKEQAPRDDHDNFYWLHEDWLKQQQAAAGPVGAWALTIWRPPLIIGHAAGTPMNVLSAVGAYGALCREQGAAMAFPGGACGPLDAVDSRLLAAALVWAAADLDAAGNQTFNITNGDVFVWDQVWPALARTLGGHNTAGQRTPCRLAEWLPARQEEWEVLRAGHNLRCGPLLEFLGDSAIYADLMLNAGGERPPAPTLLSTIKLRQAGFQLCMDTEDSLRDWLLRMRQARLLP